RFPAARTPSEPPPSFCFEFAHEIQCALDFPVFLFGPASLVLYPATQEEDSRLIAIQLPGAKQAVVVLLELPERLARPSKRLETLLVDLSRAHLGQAGEGPTEPEPHL